MAITLQSPYPIAKRYKQLFWAFIYSPIIAYLITAYTTYQSYKKYDEGLTVSVLFMTSIAEDMLRNIDITFRLVWLPFFWPVLIFYAFVFYKVFTSKKQAVEKHKTLLLVFLLVLFYLFTEQFTHFIASSI